MGRKDGAEVGGRDGLSKRQRQRGTDKTETETETERRKWAGGTD